MKLIRRRNTIYSVPKISQLNVKWAAFNRITHERHFLPRETSNKKKSAFSAPQMLLEFSGRLPMRATGGVTHKTKADWEITPMKNNEAVRAKSAGFAISLLGVKLFINPPERPYSRTDMILHPKIVQNNSKQICGWILMREDNRRWTFSQEEALLWIMESYFDKKRQLKVKNIIKMDLLLTNMKLLASEDINR